MAYTTIKKSSDYFNTKLYTGNSSTQSITGVNFQPDMTWIKARSGTHGTENHNLFDAVRGATKYLIPNGTTASTTDTNSLTAFDSDGFSLGTRTDVNGSAEYASWNWLGANGTSANTDGSINSTVSANTTSGFSIVSYTGTGSNATIGHGLGSVPKMIIVKKTNTTANWGVYHASSGNTKYQLLNGNYADTTESTAWNNTSPTNSVFSVGSWNESNASGSTYVAYCFEDVQGYSKFGSYTGNNSSDGAFVYTGFKPAFLMVKYTGAGQNWIIIDNKRNTYNLISAGDSLNLRPNTSDAEQTSNGIDLLSNGFKCRSSDGDSNGYTTPYIYMAFAEQPLVGDNPATAR